MRRHLVLASALALLLAVPSVGEARRKPRLKAFASCAQLIGYADGQARRVGAAPGGQMPPGAAPERGVGDTAQPAPAAGQQNAAAPAEGVDYSGTNVQEAGIDEPDFVKTNGRHVFVVAGDRLHAIDASTLQLAGSLKLATGYGGELLLRGTRMLVMTGASGFYGGPGPRPLGASASSPAISPYPSEATITEVDVADPSAMKVLGTLTVEGSYVSARLRGSSARVVFTSVPQAVAEKDARGKRSGWVPDTTLARAGGEPRKRFIASCRQVRRPQSFSGLDMVSVLTIDMAKGLPAVDSDAIMADAQTVYASARSLYVATQRWTETQRPDEGARTQIHSFDIADPGETRYRASGEVRGYLLNQFALSEHRGVLRAASTEEPPWTGDERPARESESFVTVLDERDGRLALRGRVDGLGKGERIYSVRFLGDEGFVVTFRQVDPLYTLDLSEPSKPRVMGELKILGYSAYLHPIGGGLLLGVGVDATEEGRRKGTQLSVFDVSDLRRPARLHHRALGGGATDVEYDHHAFLWWAPTRLAMIPLAVWDERASRQGFVGAAGFRVGREEGILDAGTVVHEGQEYAPGIRRSLVAAGRIFTVSDAGVEAGNLATLAQEGWIPFPQPPQQGGGADPGAEKPPPAR